MAVIGGGLLLLALSRGTIREGDIILFAVLIPSVILHEVSHGAVALVFGDDTAKQAGRLTLNPLAHVDPFGTVVLPAILVLSGAPAFGYAKPVPVSPRKMRDPRNHSLLTSLAGPATNLVLAAVAVALLRTVDVSGRVFLAVIALGIANVVLAVFNLIPLPPLDGSAVIERVLPRQWWPGYLRLRQYSMGVLLILVLLLPGALNVVFEPALDAFWEASGLAG